MTPEIVVIGSANLDRVVQVPRLPMPGETVLGGEYREFFGGKGANQAVAARRAAGATLRAAFVGKIGTDPGGAKYVRYLKAEGLALTFLAKDESAPTGVALITVDPGGENQIAVAPGANARISPQDMEAAGEWIRGARTLLAQLEIPLETVRTAFRLGREAGVRTVLNPAPASPGVGLEELLGWTDLVVPNRGEAGGPRGPAGGFRRVRTRSLRDSGGHGSGGCRDHPGQRRRGVFRSAGFRPRRVRCRRGPRYHGRWRCLLRRPDRRIDGGRGS